MYCRSWSRADPLFDQLHGLLKPGITCGISRDAALPRHCSGPWTRPATSGKPDFSPRPFLRGPSVLLFASTVVVSSDTANMSTL